MKITVNCDSGGFVLSHNPHDLNIFQLTLLHQALKGATGLVREVLRDTKPRAKPQRAIYEYQDNLYPNKSACGRAIAANENLDIRWPHKLCDRLVESGQVKVIGL